jgi:PAS domain S-box-containing protein
MPPDRIATALREREEQLAAQLAAMQRLQECSTQLIVQDDPAALYEKIMDAAVAIMRSDYASMQMLYPERGSGGELRLLAFRGFNPEAAKFWEWVRADSESTCGEALRTGRRAIAPDVEKCDYMAGSADLATYLQTGIHAVQTTPLISRSGRLLGMVSTHWRRPHEPSESDLGLLDVLARQAADLIERNEADEQLRRSERELADFFDNATVGLHWVGPDGIIMRANQAELDMLGYRLEEYVGRPIAEFHADRPVIDDILQRLTCGEKLREYPARLRCKDGSIRDVLINSSVLFENGKFIHTRCFTHDITERKQAETTQQTLLNELNHRVKNTLASVQAIAQQTLARTKKPADFVASFGGRIQSLARVHTLLSATTWRGADLRDLIRDQVLSGPVDETRLTAWGPAVQLDSQTALHVALMLHELGTNACKYGALSTASGWVTVNWTTDDALHIQWVERGGPPVTSPSRQGFGTTLIEQSAVGQGGEAQMLCEAEGITWKITLPLRERADFVVAPQIIQTLSSDPSAAGGKPRTSLAGRRFLVVEDEALVGLDIAAGLEDADAQVEGPIGTPEKAIDAIGRLALDGALLDANLHGLPVDEIASALTRRNIPFVFVTGHGADGLPPAFRSISILSKPFSRQQLVEAAAQLVAGKSDVVRLRR